MRAVLCCICGDPVLNGPEKPGHLRDGWAESAWVTTAKGLDVQLYGNARQR